VVDDWELTGEQTPTNSADIELTNIAGEEVDGVTTIYFTRTTKSGSYPIDADASVIVIGAYSPSNDFLSYHGDTTHSLQMNQVTANFKTGAVGSQKGKLTIKDAHAILMFIAWGLLLPFGMLWARYTRSLENDIWFLVHRPVQYTGFLISTAGIILGYVMVGEYQFRVVAHSVIGTIIFAGSILQVIGAFFRPHKKKRRTNHKRQKILRNKPPLERSYPGYFIRRSNHLGNIRYSV
jgi:archaellin